MKEYGTKKTDCHVLPKGQRDLHIIGRMSDCPCEPVPKYVEMDFNGRIKRRVIVHGSLKKGG